MSRNILLILIFSITLSSCGFKLRGLSTTRQLSGKFQKIYLYDKNSNKSIIFNTVRRLIKDNGGKLTSKEQADISVILSPVTSNLKQIVMTTDGLLKEYEKTYNTTVTILHTKNNTKLGTRNISTNKNIQLSDELSLANEEQINNTDKEAYNNLAKLIMLYLESL